MLGNELWKVMSRENIKSKARMWLIDVPLERPSLILDIKSNKYE